MENLVGDEWQEPQQHTFEELISRFATAPIIHRYEPTAILQPL